jgi:sugar O-acyltransferase (sialic acid O-acetyltransferase NeuD family)
MPDSPIVIVGAGDHGRVVLELLRARGETVAGFIEPGPAAQEVRGGIDGLSLLGGLADPTAWMIGSLRFVVALGDNRSRRDAFERCLALGLVPASAVHPTATILGGARVEPGAMVCAGALVGLSAIVEADAIVNTAASVDHDNRIGPHATVAPGAHLAGRVTLEEGAFVGIGAAVREGRTVGAWALVAGGAMVVDDVPPGARVAGVPARAMTE